MKVTVEMTETELTEYMRFRKEKSVSDARFLELTGRLRHLQTAAFRAMDFSEDLKSVEILDQAKAVEVLDQIDKIV